MLSSKGDGQAAVPVVNMRRNRMARCRQAAWLLYHVGIDASVLLFADEVDMDGLIMNQRVSLLVVGQDVLKSKAEVSSVCTILTNTYCEYAYSLLQSLDIKKLLLAGILLDTSNLSKKCTNRDSEAVQLLLFGASERMRHELFQQLMLDHNDHSFVEYLKNTYRSSTTDDNDESPPEQKRSTSASGSSQDAKKSNSNPLIWLWLFPSQLTKGQHVEVAERLQMKLLVGKTTFSWRNGLVLAENNLLSLT
ncbi:hypothetical protein PVAP13_5KG125887 [Panicum virgatum]|uniref:Uncharacterized protein n=1 Tax=Panicum virgatum TaxID=38727 RepID=A0A8T0SF43_PANVG|nr:hypothetical protein PVAP13_5KG125887 [Panicum virgatum]